MSASRSEVTRIAFYAAAIAGLALAACGPAPSAAGSDAFLTGSSSPVPSDTATPQDVQESLNATWDAQLGTYEAEQAAAIQARGMECKEGYTMDYEAFWQSTDAWSIYTCSPTVDLSTAGTPVVVDYSQSYTEVLSTDLVTHWTIPHRNFGWTDNRFAYLRAHRWSPDGRYVYLERGYGAEYGNECSRFFALDGQVLYRLNLVAGDLETLLPFSPNRWYSYALSPDDRYLAYVDLSDPDTVHIRNLVDGTEQLAPLAGNYVTTGAFAWKPDTGSLLFAAALKGWDEGEAGISLFKIEMPTLELNSIVIDDSRQLIPCLPFDPWPEDDLIQVRSLNHLSDAFNCNLAADFNTGKILIYGKTPKGCTTPTPTP